MLIFEAKRIEESLDKKMIDQWKKRYISIRFRITRLWSEKKSSKILEEKIVVENLLFHHSASLRLTTFAIIWLRHYNL